VYVVGQKVRSKATRDFPLHPVTKAWLAPFSELKGEMWTYKKAYDDKMKSLFEKVGLERLYDGFRHSYASYRIRHLKGNLATLADEMGNSPQEIINSYKKNVTDEDAENWFGIKPPKDYANKIKRVLAARQTSKDEKELKAKAKKEDAAFAPATLDDLPEVTVSLSPAPRKAEQNCLVRIFDKEPSRRAGNR
jgi:hypothetical protein